MDFLTLISEMVPAKFWVGFAGFLVWWRIWQYGLKSAKTLVKRTAWGWDDNLVMVLMEHTDRISDWVGKIATLDPAAFARAKKQAGK